MAVLSLLAYHLHDAGHGRQFEFQEPILKRAELGKVTLAAPVDHGVLVDPTDAGRIWTQLRVCVFRKRAGHRGKSLDNPRAGPVLVDVIFEDDINEARPK